MHMIHDDLTPQPRTSAQGPREGRSGRHAGNRLHIKLVAPPPPMPPPPAAAPPSMRSCFSARFRALKLLAPLTSILLRAAPPSIIRSFSALTSSSCVNLACWTASYSRLMLCSVHVHTIARKGLVPKMQCYHVHMCAAFSWPERSHGLV